MSASAPMEFRIQVNADDDGSLWATVEGLPGCFASGSTIGELIDAVEEAVGMCIDSPIRIVSFERSEPEPANKVPLPYNGLRASSRKEGMLVAFA